MSSTPERTPPAATRDATFYDNFVPHAHLNSTGGKTSVLPGSSTGAAAHSAVRRSRAAARAGAASDGRCGRFADQGNAGATAA